jgi:hypothetical protein
MSPVQAQEVHYFRLELLWNSWVCENSTRINFVLVHARKHHGLSGYRKALSFYEKEGLCWQTIRISQKVKSESTDAFVYKKDGTPVELIVFTYWFLSRPITRIMYSE